MNEGSVLMRRVKGIIIERHFKDCICMSKRFKATMLEINLLWAAEDVQSDHNLVVR